MAGGGNLGKASLVLTTKDQTGKGLSKAEGGIKAWAGGVKAKVAGAIAFVGGIIGAFKSAAALGDRFNSLGEIGKQASAIGVASDQFMGLAAAAKMAGVEGEQFGTLLQKGQLRVAEGSADTQQALATIGLSLDQLRGKSPDEIFYAVADGLNGVSDQGTRALVATKLFEEEGVKLLPVLARGSAGLKEFVAQQKAMGTAIGQGDMNGILLAQARMAQIGQRIEGVMNRIVVAGLPFLDLALDITESIIDMAPPFNDVKFIALAVFKAIGMAGGYVWDHMKMQAGAVSVALGGWIGLAGKALQLVGKTKEGADALKLGGDMTKWGVEQFVNFGQSAANVDKWFDNLGGKAAPKVGQKIGDAAGKAMAKAFEYHQNAAVERGSKEDWSARIRWEQQQQTLHQQQAQKAAEIAKNTAATTEAIKSLPNRMATSTPVLKVV